eukprot:jgi/Tetstr1/464296/TSEL_009098.t1
MQRATAASSGWPSGAAGDRRHAVDDEHAHSELHNSGKNFWAGVLRAIFPLVCYEHKPEISREAAWDDDLERSPSWDGLEVDDHGSPHSGSALRQMDVTYEVSVCTTKSIPGAGNTAPAWVAIVGERGRTSRLQLLARDVIMGGRGLPGMPAQDAAQAFKPGVTVTFVLKAKRVGRLICCLVGLDGSGGVAGAGRPAWHLDFLHVREHSCGQDCYFPCNRWLSQERDGGFLQRVLRAYDDPPQEHKCKYKVSLHTSDMKGARCDSTVSITLYGLKGCSGRRSLQTFFERGAVNSFEFSGLDIGCVTAIRVGHNGRGIVSPHWHLAAVRVENVTTGSAEEFPVHRWFDRHREDGLIEREIFPAGIHFHGQQTVYKITLYTGHVSGHPEAGGLLLELHGMTAQAGPLLLDNGGAGWEAGMHVFLVRALDVGPLLAARLWLDGPPPHGVERPLEHMEVCSHEARRVYHFDGRACAGLGYVLEPLCHSGEDGYRELKMVFYTSDIVHAGTSAAVSVQLQGSAGDSEVLALGNGHTNFPRGGVDEFRRSVRDLGRITSVVVSHDGTGLGQGWHLEVLEITDLGTNQVSFFPCGKWLDKAYGSAEMQLLCSAVQESPTVQYRVQIKTSSFRGAGTAAKVYLILYGDRGNSGKHPLSGSFARGAFSTFFITVPHSIGKIYKAILGHDNSSLTPGWHVDMLEVVNCITSEICLFELKCWLDKKESGVIAKECWPVGRSAPPSLIEYKIEVATGSHITASSSGLIEVVLLGSRGCSQPLHLTGQRHQRGKSLSFTVQSEPIGELQQLEVTHHGNARNSTWQLQGITVSHASGGGAGGPGDIKKYFPARCWFVEGKRTVTLSEGPMDEDFLTGPLSRRASDDSALSHVSVNSDLLVQLKGSFLDEAGK